MTATALPPVSGTETERDHLMSLTGEQLKTLCAHNEAAYTGTGKKKMVDALLAAEFLPAYPDGIPAFEGGEPEPAANGDADANGDVDNAARTVAPEDLPTDNGESGDDAMRAVDGETGVGLAAQLTFDGLGEAPTKGVLNLPALRLELPAGEQYSDGDVLQVTAFVKVDTLKFYPETVGKAGVRKVRGHSAKWLTPAERVVLTIAAE